MKRIVLLVLITIPLFASCLVDSGDWGSWFSGIVTDSVTGLPVESALVYGGDTTQVIPVATDSTGAYAWANFGYGPNTVFVRRTGYLTAIRTFPKWRGMKKGVDFRLVSE